MSGSSGNEQASLQDAHPLGLHTSARAIGELPSSRQTKVSGELLTVEASECNRCFRLKFCSFPPGPPAAEEGTSRRAFRMHIPWGSTRLQEPSENFQAVGKQK